MQGCFCSIISEGVNRVPTMASHMLFGDSSVDGLP